MQVLDTSHTSLSEDCLSEVCCLLRGFVILCPLFCGSLGARQKSLEEWRVWLWCVVVVEGKVVLRAKRWRSWLGSQGLAREPVARKSAGFGGKTLVSNGLDFSSMTVITSMVNAM